MHMFFWLCATLVRRQYEGIGDRGETSFALLRPFGAFEEQH